MVCSKGDFKVGDLGIFFEIDSLCPDVAPFNEIEFLVKKHLKIKTQKIRGVYSQGLFLPLSTFSINEADVVEGQDMMARLGITYYVSEDNKRKSNGGTGVANPANIMKRIQQAVPWTRTAPKFMYPVIRAMYGKQVKPRMCRLGS